MNCTVVGICDLSGVPYVSPREQMKEVERLREVEAAVHVQTMDFLEKKRNQLQEDVDTWVRRHAAAAAAVELPYVPIFLG